MKAVGVDEPLAGPGEVIVAVMAASVNDVDRAARRGSEGGPAGNGGGAALGRDFVGTVTAVGRGVDFIAVGALVAGVFGPPDAGTPGTFAEKVAVPVGLVAPVPEGIDLAHAAGVGLAGVTALDAVSALGAGGLGRVVIHGPMGGVGGFAVQLAKARGAVVAVVTNPAHVDLARELGADVVLTEDVDSERTIRKVHSRFGNADTAIHIAGDPAVAAAVVRPGGRFTSVTGVAPVDRPGVEYVKTRVVPTGHKLADLLFRVASRRLRSCVRHAVSFERVGDAINLDSATAVGRVVVLR